MMFMDSVNIEGNRVNSRHPHLKEKWDIRKDPIQVLEIPLAGSDTERSYLKLEGDFGSSLAVYEPSIIEVQDLAPTPMEVQHLTLPLAIWEGTVQALNCEAGTFHAVLVSRSSSVEDQIIEVPFDEVDDADRDLLVKGGVFYLEHHQRNDLGGRETTQQLRFRRYPAWTIGDRDWMIEEANRLDTLLAPYIEVTDD